MKRPAPTVAALRLWIPVFLYTAFIFWLSSAPRPIPRVLWFPQSDKFLHILEYLPLGVLTIRAFSRTWEDWPIWKVSLCAALWVLCTGTADEIYQRFVPTRVSSPFDAAADLIGGVVGQLFWKLSASLRRRT